jgi:formamidopyrimidine-DNA glycosylase
MPELPEVETITNDLKKSVLGYEISDFWTDSPTQILPNAIAVKKGIIAGKIIGVERLGKLIVFWVSWYSGIKALKQHFLGIHLKMSGRVFLRKKSDAPDKYCHAILTMRSTKTDFNDPSYELRFCDMRKFGYIRFYRNKEELEKMVNTKLGPGPFDKKFTASYLQDKFSGKNTTIKSALLNQRIISGIGNIYANEALFVAGIRPNKAVTYLNINVLKRLRTSIIKVLKQGIKHRGSSSKDEGYKDLFGNLGTYQKHFLVYEKKGKSCPNSCGGVIKYDKVSGRGTFWCEKCQR